MNNKEYIRLLVRDRLGQPILINHVRQQVPRLPHAEDAVTVEDLTDHIIEENRVLKPGVPF